MYNPNLLAKLGSIAAQTGEPPSKGGNIARIKDSLP
jgi:hypothetical protein